MFADFLAAQRPRRSRHAAWTAASVTGHLLLLLLLAWATHDRRPEPTPAPEPIVIHMPRAGSPRPRQVEAPRPRQARRPRRPPPPLVQPSQPAPPVEPAPEPTPELEPEPEAQEGVGAVPAPEPAVAAPGPPGPPQGLAIDQDTVLELRDVARPPRMLTQVTPQYPREAKSRRIEGLVLLRVIVARDGTVERDHIQVVRSVPALDAAAIVAMSGWRFSPALAPSGQPVRVIIEVPFQFFLR
jgi:periplasmic protein TonB